MNAKNIGNSMKKIDFHTHYLSPGYVEFLKRHFNGFCDGLKTPPWNLETCVELLKSSC